MAAASPPPNLQPNTSEDLVRLHQAGDRAARDAVVARMMPLIQRCASKYGAPHQREDLEQVAALACVRALDRFDPDRGASLTSFLVPTMLGECRRYLRDHGWAIHLPRPLQERVLETTKATERLRTSLGRSPTVAELAQETGASEDDVLETMQASHAWAASSLDAPVNGVDDGGEPTTLGDALGGDDEALDRAEDAFALDSLAAHLQPLERKVLWLRFQADLTQSEIAERVGCSQMQVSRILRRSLVRLEELARADGGLAVLRGAGAPGA